jgi:putative transposase
MYGWREMTDEERAQAMAMRRARGFPKHSPPHWKVEGERRFLVSAACFEHAPVVGKSPERMTECESEALKTCRDFCSAIYAWCVLPNHYHILLRTERIGDLRGGLGRFHGRSSFKWNGEDQRRGRQIWFNCFERPMKSERHFWASLNYVHHNPVHHGYVERWQDWPWSSAAEFLEREGREQVAQMWKEYPILDYGKKWDNF